MPSAEAIQKIRSFDLDALRETLAACPPPEGGSIEPLVESATRWVAALCEDIARLLEAIDDPDDCAMTLAIQYVELKSRWIALNTRMNYSMFRTGGFRVVEQGKVRTGQHAQAQSSQNLKDQVGGEAIRRKQPQAGGGVEQGPRRDGPWRHIGRCHVRGDRAAAR